MNKTNNYKQNCFSKKGIHYYLSVLLIGYPMFYPAVDLFGHVGQYLLFFVWLFFSIINKPNFTIKILESAGVYIVFYIVIILRVLNVWEIAPLDFYSPKRLITQLLLVLVYYIFGLWNNLYSNNVVKKGLINAFFTSFFISSLISIYYLLNNSYAIRRSFDYSYFAIGDFNLVYSGVFIGIILSILIINNKCNLKRIVLVVVTSFLIIKASYMTAIAIYTVFLIVNLMIKFKKISMISVLIMVIMLFFGMNFLGNFILDLSQLNVFTDAIQSRLQDIAKVFLSEGLENSTTILDRYNRAKVSLDSFIQSPIIGINYENYNHYTIGHHIQHADNLARFGIIGNLILAMQYIYWFFQIRKVSKGNINRISLWCSWILFFILGVINNNVLGGVLICMFFVSGNISVLFED